MSYNVFFYVSSFVLVFTPFVIIQFLQSKKNSLLLKNSLDGEQNKKLNPW
jgi:hypothetical protein